MRRLEDLDPFAWHRMPIARNHDPSKLSLPALLEGACHRSSGFPGTDDDGSTARWIGKIARNDLAWIGRGDGRVEHLTEQVASLKVTRRRMPDHWTHMIAAHGQHLTREGLPMGEFVVQLRRALPIS
jgi:hypothetical protein